MVDKNEIFEQVASTLTRLFDLDRESIYPGSRLMEDLDVDSIDAVDLMVELKKHVGKKISPEDFKAVRTVDDIVNALSELIDQGELKDTAS